jgi:short-subunit dehydrogenase
MGNNLTILKLFAEVKARPGMRVCVTGASSGIGKEISIQYAKRGYKLVLAGRDVKALAEVQNACLNLGSKQVEIIATDVRERSQCKALIENSVSILGGIDILVLCAGVSAHQLFSDITDLDIFNELLQTNFFGYLYCTFFALKHLKESKGQILVISSISGEIGLPYRSAYCTSKFAVTGFFESLRSEMDQDEVAITIVCPPSVRTNLRNNSLVKVEGEKDNEYRINVEECVRDILAAADRRARKIFFPLKVYFAVYCRPFFPDLIDKKLKKAAKL